MKKTIISIIAAAVFTGCAQTKVIEGVRYDTYGVLNETSKKNSDIEYEVSGWSIAWSVLLLHTVVVPAYLIGFDLYQPMDKVDEMKPKGSID